MLACNRSDLYDDYGVGAGQSLAGWRGESEHGRPKDNKRTPGNRTAERK